MLTWILLIYSYCSKYSQKGNFFNLTIYLQSTLESVTSLPEMSSESQNTDSTISGYPDFPQGCLMHIFKNN